MVDEKFNKTQKSLFIVHMLRVVLELFTSTFLTSHIISVNPSDALGSGVFNIGLFFISQYFVYGVLYLFMSYFVDKSNRVTFLRIGILVNTFLLIALVLWGNVISEWVILAGALCGISDAFYYPSYLVMKNELNQRSYMKKYNILVTIMSNLIRVVVPTILGYLIDVSSFSSVAIYIVIITIIQYSISYFIKSNKPENSAFEPRKYFRFLKENKEIRNKVKFTYINAILVGPKSAYKMIVVILTVYIFKTNLSLGLFTSIFAFFTMLCLLLFKKFEESHKFNKMLVYAIIGIFPVISCVIMVFTFNKPSLIIYNFFITIAVYFSDYFGSLERDYIIKNIHKNEFIAEHQCIVEALQNLSRIIAYGTFLVVGLFASITAFKIMLVILILSNPIKYAIMYKQRLIRKEFEQ